MYQSQFYNLSFTDTLAAFQFIEVESGLNFIGGYSVLSGETIGKNLFTGYIIKYKVQCAFCRAGYGEVTGEWIGKGFGGFEITARERQSPGGWPKAERVTILIGRPAAARG